MLSVSTQTSRSVVRSSPAGKWLLGAGVAVAAAAAAWAAWRRSSSSVSASSSAAGSSRPLPCRPLHWVIKVGDLKATVDFYSTVLVLAVQRHEEFDQGCEATCNGPYSGWWSKTMMSFPGKGEDAFSLELTYNYGVSTYALGNDLIGLHVRVPGAAERARAAGLDVQETEEAGVLKVQSPDGQWLFLHPIEGGVANASVDPFLYVSLHTSDLARARAFYLKVLGMSEFDSSAKGAAGAPARAGVRPGAAWSMLGFTAPETKIELVELPRGTAVNHAAAFGRIAFAGDEVLETYARATAAGSTVLHPPVTLDTPGKARVQVTILADTDGNEICVVDRADFQALAEPKAGAEVVPWEWREKAIRKQTKFMKAFGADGQAPASAKK